MKNTNKTFGYCRISTSKQSLDRQINNVKRAYPDSDIRAEVYTGTKSNRPEWTKLLKEVRAGDTIVFDSVSRMSRNAEEGFVTYMNLYNKGVNLVFLKEQTISTDSFKTILGEEQFSIRLNTPDEDANQLVNGIMKEVAAYITRLAQKQIQLAFAQSEKEVTDLHERTSEGLREAKRQGKQVGRVTGSTITTKKSVAVKELIVKHHKAFHNGNLNDIDCMALINGTCGITRNTYYKYKKELFEEYDIK